MKQHILLTLAAWLLLTGVTYAGVSVDKGLLPVGAAVQQTVNGVVVMADGSPIAGATVRSHATSRATTTDGKGAFTLQVPIGDTLLVSYVGFAEQRVPATGTDLRITLADASNALVKDSWNELTTNISRSTPRHRSGHHVPRTRF